MEKIILESIEVKKRLLDKLYLDQILKIGGLMIDALKLGKHILVAGNGGSAADAQHFAAELAGKFEKVRKGLPALALTTNTSNITAIGNDFSFDQIFSRQIDALGRPGDVFVGISTSGNSKNIMYAMQTSKKKGLNTIGLLGNQGGAIKDLCNISLIIPSQSTARIQECHILVIHILSAMIDDAFTS